MQDSPLTRQSREEQKGEKKGMNQRTIWQMCKGTWARYRPAAYLANRQLIRQRARASRQTPQDLPASHQEQRGPSPVVAAETLPAIQLIPPLHRPSGAVPKLGVAAGSYIAQYPPSPLGRHVFALSIVSSDGLQSSLDVLRVCVGLVAGVVGGFGDPVRACIGGLFWGGAECCYGRRTVRSCGKRLPRGQHFARWNSCRVWGRRGGWGGGGGVEVG